MSIIDYRLSFPYLYHQQSSKCCTAEAICYLFRFYVQRVTPHSFFSLPSSPMFLYYNIRTFMGTTSYDSGSVYWAAFQALQTYGMCPESTWPFSLDLLHTVPPSICYQWTKWFPFQMSSQCLWSFPFNPDRLLPLITQSLWNGNVLLASMRRTRQQYIQEDGKLQTPDEMNPDQQCIPHSIVIVGINYDTEIVHCLNSYGIEGGKQGFFWIPFQQIPHILLNLFELSFMFSSPHLLLCDMIPMISEYEKLPCISIPEEEKELQECSQDPLPLICFPPTYSHQLFLLGWSFRSLRTFHHLFPSIPQDTQILFISQRSYQPFQSITIPPYIQKRLSVSLPFLETRCFLFSPTYHPATTKWLQCHRIAFHLLPDWNERSFLLQQSPMVQQWHSYLHGQFPLVYPGPSCLQKEQWYHHYEWTCDTTVEQWKQHHLPPSFCVFQLIENHPCFFPLDDTSCFLTLSVAQWVSHFFQWLWISDWCTLDQCTWSSVMELWIQSCFPPTSLPVKMGLGDFLQDFPPLAVLEPWVDLSLSPPHLTLSHSLPPVSSSFTWNLEKSHSSSSFTLLPMESPSPKERKGTTTQLVRVFLVFPNPVDKHSIVFQPSSTFGFSSPPFVWNVTPSIFVFQMPQTLFPFSYLLSKRQESMWIEFDMLQELWSSFVRFTDTPPIFCYLSHYSFYYHPLSFFFHTVETQWEIGK